MWHNFFKEKPEVDKDVLWFYDYGYDVGFYEKDEDNINDDICFDYEMYFWSGDLDKMEQNNEPLLWCEIPDLPKEVI